MKIKSVVAIVCIWMCGTLSLSAAKPSAAERQQAATTMKALAESRDYTVRIAQAFPLKGASVATPLAILRINGNEAYSTLPYWGGGYNTFGNSDGMRFTGTVSDYTVNESIKRIKYKLHLKQLRTPAGLPIQDGDFL